MTGLHSTPKEEDQRRICNRVVVEGHLFIINGDLTKLSCDAWLLPTSASFGMKTWRHALSPDDLACVEELTWKDGTDIQPLTEKRPDTDPWIWLGNIGRSGKSPEWYADKAVEFVELASVRIDSRPRSGRHLPLLAVNVLGTGRGGKASEKGELCKALIPKLREAAEGRGVDVVLVTWGQAAYSAAQRVRQNLVADSGQPEWNIEKTWELGDHSSQLIETAKELAQAAQEDHLVLFIGAGVGSGAGVPAWQALIAEIASDAGLGEQLDQLKKLDLRDQAAVLQRQLEKKNQSLGKLVSKYTNATRYSLAHSLLASLGVREAVTTNYDGLYEAAVGSHEGGIAVLPGNSVKSGQSWLLKLHGSIEDEGNLVLTRDDYLGIATRRGALLGLLQAMMLTRRMLFIGYSLTDEDFHSVVNDVRMATLSSQTLGVAITLFENEFFEDLWSRDIDVVPQSGPDTDPSPEAIAEAGRRVLIFLDLIGYLAADMDAFLLETGYAGMLSTDELHLVDALKQLAGRVPEDEGGPGWRRVRSVLNDFGWPKTKTDPE